MARSAAHVEYALALYRFAALDGFLITQAHALAEEAIDNAIDDTILVAINRVEVVGVLVKESLGTIRRHENLPIGGNC